MSDTTPKVTGIGGIFFRSKNPEETRSWYGENLGLAISPYGSSFEFRMPIGLMKSIISVGAPLLRTPIILIHQKRSL